MSLALSLPIELLYCISKCLDDLADLSSWSRSCRSFHAALTPILYHHVKDDQIIMCWACDKGRLGTIQRLLDAGADPNVAWTQDEPRYWTLRGEDAETSPSSSPQPASDGPSRYSADVCLRIFAWFMEHARIQNEMIEYFQEGSYAVDDHNGAAVLDLPEDDEREYHRSWPVRYHWNPYKSVKTFPQRCYWTPLHIAAAWGNNELVNLLLDNGVDINAPSRLFCKCATRPNRRSAALWTPLHSSICHGHESTTRLLISRGASIHVTTRYRGRDERRYTALHSACTVGLLDTARALVDEGYQTDVTVRDHEDLTPLAYAFFQGNWSVVHFLLEHGADINDKIGPLNALGHACLLGYFEEALRLLDLGVTPQCEFHIKDEPHFYFHLIAVAGTPDFASSRASKQKEFRLELVNRLIQHGIDVNQQGTNGTTALAEAASFHRTDVVKALLHAGAGVRASICCALKKAISLPSREAQKTPKGAMLNTVHVLLEAMTGNHGPRLLDVGAVGPDDKESDTTDDVDISDAFRVICLSPQKHKDKLEVANLFLKYKRSIAMAKMKPHLVCASILATNFKISNLLLENGFDQPCEGEMEDLIAEFLEHDIAEGLRYILNRFPETAPRIRSSQRLCHAVDTGSEECAEFLIDEGVSINSRNEDGSSLLFTACMMEDYDTAELILKKGADPNECTQEGGALTVQAALNEDRDMVRLLLDYGASIHSSPPGKPTRHPDMGLLDIAISCGLEGVVEEIANHKNFDSPTDEEITRHWQTMINASGSVDDLTFLLDPLLDSTVFDADQVFTMKDAESGSLVPTTPLHLSAAIGIIANRINIIEYLIGNGADIHKFLPLRPDSRNRTLNPESSLTRVMEFEGTTPLEWAISFSSIMVVRAFLGQEVEVYGRFLSPQREATKTNRMELMLLYAKAACRRQNAKMFSLLFKKGLDPTICDEDGNTMIHTICDYVETFWPNDDPEWTMEIIAGRAAASLIVCLKWDVTDSLKNKKGESGMDRVLQILNYSGNCEFHQTLAKVWRENIDYVEGSSPKLIAKVAAIDDSDDEEFDGEASDDEPSDGGLDMGSETSDEEPNPIEDSWLTMPNILS